jgi:hypothetical protein
MGDMTYAEMITELGFLLGNRTDSDAIDTDRRNRWLNQAYTYMCHPSVHHFREMQAIDNSTTLVTDDDEYLITQLDSINVVAIRFVTHIEATAYSPTASRRKLTPRSIRWLNNVTNRSGRPTHYVVDGNSLFLYGVPRSTENGQILRIGYYREPQVLGVNLGVTELNTYFDRPLMKFTQAFAEADLGDKAKALVTLKEAAGLLNNAVPESELEAEEDGHQVEFVLQPAMGFF